MQPDQSQDAMLAAAQALIAQNEAIRASKKPEPLRTLTEWLADPQSLISPQPIIPYLVLAGRVTLLAAREKAGKSTLLGQAVAAFSHGGDFLGAPCGPGRVIWYAIDEAAGDAVRRLSGCYADGDAVVIQSQRPTSEHLRAHILEFQPALVVVDTLTELLASRLTNDRDAMEWTRALGPYMDVLRETETAAVLVHHATKDGRNYRGSGQLGAKVDVIALLKIPGANNEQEEDPDVDPEVETRRTLEVRGRGLNGRDRLHFDGTEYRLGEGEHALSARVVRAIGEGASSANKVAKVVTGRRETITTAIQRLVEGGKVIREGDTLRVPLFGGSGGGSPHHKTQPSGNTPGTTINYASTTSHTSREPLGKYREIPEALTGTTGEPATSGVFPDPGSYAPQTGNTPQPSTQRAGFGVSPGDEATDSNYWRDLEQDAAA